MSFAAVAFVASVITGLPLSYLGLFVVLRRVTFLGAALGELASAGIALGVLLNWPIMLGAGILTLVGVLLFSIERPHLRVPEEAWMAVTFVAAGAAAVLMLNFAPGGEADMMKLLFGNILGFDPDNIPWMLGAYGAVCFIHILFFKEFLLVSFDQETARVMGYRVWFWNFILYLTLGIAISLAISVSGVMVAFSYLVFPSLIALLLCRRWLTCTLLALCSGFLTSAGGVWASLKWDLPTGSAIIAVSFFLLLVSLLLWKFKS